MATRIVDFPIIDYTRHETQKVANSDRQQHFNDVTFTCHFCHESVKRATFLSCLHSFCKTCIDEKVQQEEAESVQCPLCPCFENKSLELQSNPLPELINKLKQLKTCENLRCTDCVSGDTGETAVAYCVDCKAAICKIDKKSHDKYNIDHFILQLHTLQESSVQDILTSLQLSTQDSNSTASVTESKDLVSPSEDANSNMTSSTNILQEDSILEAKSHICKLEDRKSNLEKKWNDQTTQVLTFFQQLSKQLETRQAVLLEELSRKYQTLITPLEDGIQQLEQIITYTGYVDVLSKYSYVTGISHKPEDRLQDISLFVTNFNIPSDSYSVKVNLLTQLKIERSLNEFLTVAKSINYNKNKNQMLYLVPKNHEIYELSQETTLKTPSDIKYASATDMYYVLFDTHWKTYQQIHNSLHLNKTIKVTVPTSFSINSSMTHLNNSVIIMSNHIVYVYSQEGEVLNQLFIENQVGFTYSNPRLYTFAGINSIYITSIESPIVCKVNSQTGVSEGLINITNYSQQILKTCHAYLVDMARSSIDGNLLLILHRANLTYQTIQSENQYYIQVYNINNLQYIGFYTLSQRMSDFCCMTTYTRTHTLYDRLYVLDLCSGSVHIYKLDQIQSTMQYNYTRGYPGTGNTGTRTNTPTSITLKKESDCFTFPKSTKIEGKKFKDSMIRSFINERKDQIMLLSIGEVHFISIVIHNFTIN